MAIRIVTSLVYIFVFPGLLFLFFYSTFAEWVDRKVYARFQNRIGPLHTGRSGILQPVADFIKLLAKEDVVPAGVDKRMFWALPLFTFASALTAFLYIPIFRVMPKYTSFNGDIIVVIYLLSLPSIVYFLAGWHSTNFFSTVGSFRTITQLFGYEVPLLLAFLAPALLAGSWRINEIVQFFQGRPYLLPCNLVGFVVAILTLQAKLERVPFDAPEAETEIVAGPLTEYSGKKLALFRLSVDIEMVVGSGLIAALFLGGFAINPVMIGTIDIAPVLGVFIFIAKTLAVIFLLSLVRALMARLRIDQMVSFSWRWLAPLGLVQILIAVLIRTFWL